MNLSKDRFYKSTVTKRFTLECKGMSWDTPYTRYTYETKNRLYDVDIRDSDNDKTYHVNGSGLTSEPHAIHHAIEKHFGV